MGDTALVGCPAGAGVQGEHVVAEPGRASVGGRGRRREMHRRGVAEPAAPVSSMFMRSPVATQKSRIARATVRPPTRPSVRPRVSAAMRPAVRPRVSATTRPLVRPRISAAMRPSIPTSRPAACPTPRGAGPGEATASRPSSSSTACARCWPCAHRRDLLRDAQRLPRPRPGGAGAGVGGRRLLPGAGVTEALAGRSGWRAPARGPGCVRRQSRHAPAGGGVRSSSFSNATLEQEPPQCGVGDRGGEGGVRAGARGQGFGRQGPQRIEDRAVVAR